MTETTQEERLRWVLPIIEKKVRLIDMERVCPHSKRSLERWVALYKKGGEESLIPHSTGPKSEPGGTPIHIKEHIIRIRKKTRLCARKLAWRLRREDQGKFYEQNIFSSFEDLQKKMRRWNMYYNDLEHCGLGGKTPNEFLREYRLTHPPNVCS